MNRRLVVEDGRSARELLLIGTVVVGRDPKCEISHADPRLSRRHAEFSLGPQGVVVRDLGSRNGIRVNGTPVRQATLSPGDVVQIAQLTVRFVDGAAAVAAPSRAAASFDTAATIATTVEDDRTRLAPSPPMPVAGPRAPAVRASGAAAAVAVAPSAAPLVGSRPDPDDDRTRVVSGIVPGERAAPRARDLGEVTFREAVPGTSTPRLPAERGVGSLLASRWGRQVLAQGLLLALVVFLLSTFPLIAWQMQTFGMSVAQSLLVLAPGALASAAAGLIVAGRIARTVARGLRSEEP